MKVQEIKEIKENVSFESVTLLTAVVSGLFNLLVGAGKITMGLFMRSYFLCISGCFNLLMGLSRQCCFAAIRLHRNAQSANKRAAFLMILASLMYGIYMSQYIFTPATSSNYPGFVSFFIAVISIAELGFAIAGLIRAGKHSLSLLLRDLRMISFASALQALVLAQVAFLSFDTPLALRTDANGWAGVVCSIFCLLLGVYMLFRPQLEEKRRGR